MKLRKHAIQRIIERSELPPKHVSDIVSHRAVVGLGFGRDCRFSLFYSPPDKGTKIALVSRDWQCLFSVWNSDFLLPHGITRITRELEEEACEVLKKFLHSRFGGSEVTAQLAVTIDIRIGREILSVRDGGDIRAEDARTQNSILTAIGPQLAPIATRMNENTDDDPNHVRYGIHLINPRTLLPAKRVLLVRHQTALRHVCDTA